MRHTTFLVFVSAAALFPAAAGAEIVDRIAVTVGRQVITESAVVEEIRVTAFLAATAPDWSDANRTRTANRLVDQLLIKRELDATRFPPVPDDDTNKVFDQLKAATPDFSHTLGAAHLTEIILKEHLQWQVTFLRFVDYRFRPGIQITESDLRDFYETQAVEWRQQNKTVPTFEKARQDLERLLSSKYVDQALDRWLGDQRTQTQIVLKRSMKQP